MKRMYFLMMTMLLSLAVLAQDGGKTDVDINLNKDNGGGFFANPVVWIVGAAVFILLLVALLRGGRRAD